MELRKEYHNKDEKKLDNTFNDNEKTFFTNGSDNFYINKLLKEINENNDNKLNTITNSNIGNTDNDDFSKTENEKVNITKLAKNDKKSVKNNTSKNDNIHKDHRQRLKEQFLRNGITALTDIQKLELLLFYAIPQKDTNPIAHALIDEFGSLKDVFNAEISQLITISGVKENTAILLKLVNNLFTAISMPNENDYISSTLEAKNFCSKLYIGVEVEQFYTICLTKSNRIKKIKLIQSGSADEISLQIRKITEFALETKCNRIIVSHNHPSGEATMSDNDCSFTYSLICSCLLNSIELIDHVIVGLNSSTSLAAQKTLLQLKERAVKKLDLSKETWKYISSLSKDYIIEE